MIKFRSLPALGLAGILALTVAAESSSEFRTWTNARGRALGTARCKSVDGAYAILETRSGKIVKLKIQSLSSRDREYIKRIGGAETESISVQQARYPLKDTQAYSVKHTVTVSEPSGGTLSSLTVILPVPDPMPHQKVDGEPTVLIRPLMQEALPISKPSRHFSIVESEPFSSDILKLELKNLSLSEALKVELKYRLKVGRFDYSPDALKKVPLSAVDADDMGAFLKPGLKVESEDEAIREKLNAIFPKGINANDSVYDNARAIYDWVLNHCSYQLNSERGRAGTLWGARDILDTGKGECGDYAALFIALCRAGGIPARGQVGFWADNGGQSPHCWASFFVPGQGWVPVDPSAGDHGGKSADRYFALVPDLNKRVTVSACFDHLDGDRELALLQTFAWYYRYQGQPVKPEVSHSFTVTSLSE